MKKNIAVFLVINWLFISGLFGQSPSSKPGANPESLDTRLNNLVQQISAGLAENQKRIAVVEFVDLKGNVSDFGRYVAEELITRLFQTGKLKVIERQLLNKVVAEQKLSLTGVIEPASAQKLGKLLGVDAICSGSISDLGKTLKINARLINTETGEVFSVAATEIVKDESVCALGGCKKSNDDDPATESDSSSSANRSNLRIDSNFFTFEIMGCVVSGTTAVCDGIVTNKEKDRIFTLYGYFFKEMLFGKENGTRAFDQNNNTYLSKGVQIANSNKDNLVSATLITNTPTKIKIFFEGVTSEATKFSVLEIGFKTQGPNITTVKVRNIPLTKGTPRRF